MKVSINYFLTYALKAYYKGFIIYDKDIPRFSKNVNINLDLYQVLNKS